MLRTFLIFTFFSALLMASSTYTVRLAVFKHANKLQSAINHYPPALKKTVKTYTKHGYTYAYTLPTSDKATLEKLLPAYKKVFNDAYIQPTRLK